MNNLFRSLLLSIFCCYGCYEPTEGCLEFWATDYDVLADEPCEENACCTPPKLNFIVKYYKNDSTTYSFNDTLFHSPSGTYYSLLSANLYTHGYTLFDIDGEVIPTLVDSVLIQDRYYTSDFAFNTKVWSSIQLHEYKDEFDIQTVDFVVGIPALLQDTTIFGADSKIVASAIDSLYNDVNPGFFSTFSCNIGYDTIAIDTIQYKTLALDSIDISLTFDNVAQVNYAENTTITGRVYVTDWMNSIPDLQAEQSEIARQLIESLEEHMILELN